MAHATLVWTRYQWLALEARQAEDPRTIGDLFSVQCRELEDGDIDEDSITWRGRPLDTFAPVVQCIGHTRTRRGGAIQAVLDERTVRL